MSDLREYIADKVCDPFDRKRLTRAIESLEDGCVDNEDKDTLLEYAPVLLELNTSEIIGLLAAIGYAPAVTLALFGGPRR